MALTSVYLYCCLCKSTLIAAFILPLDCRYYPLFVVSCTAQSQPHHHHAPGPRVPSAGLPRQCGGCPGTVLYCTMLYCTVWWLPSPGSPYQLHPPAAPRPGQALRGVILGVLERLARLPRRLCCLPQGCSRHSCRVMSGTLNITHITACTATVNHIFTHRSKIHNCLIER